MRLKKTLLALLLSGSRATWLTASAACLIASAAHAQVVAGTANGQDAARLYQRSLAATCANCHGTDGRTTEGSAIPALAAMPRDYMIQQLNAFKEGTRPATVMHQLAKGLTQEQIESVAAYFAVLKR